MGGVIKPWDHILGTVYIDCGNQELFISVPPVSPAASAVAGELRLPSLKADLQSKYHPDAARPPSLYAECKSIIDGFMSPVQSSPYKYNNLCCHTVTACSCVQMKVIRFKEALF